MRCKFRIRHRGSLSADPKPFYVDIFFFRSFPVFVLILVVFLCDNAQAQFASQFSLSLGEEYNDNIFFTKQREHDFITQITPTFSLQLRPTTAPTHAFNFDFSPTGEIYARNSDLNNFGDNLTFNGGYSYDYSPRLNFRLANSLRRQGDTRTAGFGAERDRRQPLAPTQPPVVGLPVSQTLGDFISDGQTLANNFGMYGRYLFAPDITLSAEYNNAYTSFLDAGGTEFSNRIALRGIYNWRQEHNIHAGYSLEIIKTRDGENNVVHNFDVGDDYFSNTKIELTPTLTLTLSTGLSFNAGGDGPSIANNSNLTLTKLWETAMFTIGGRKGLTGSHGVAGISDTTSFFTTFNIRLTERLSGNFGADYSLFDTDDVNFNTMQVNAGLQYAITSWLCSSLGYGHRRRDSGAGSNNTDLLTRGNIYSNSVFVAISGNFDVWPSMGLAKSARSCSAGIQPVGDRQERGFPR
jgi:hypothetical protein